MLKTPTPHISAKPGDFGKTVLMPGDPLRSKFIAENFLENPVLVNNVRGVQGYTGYYKGVKVSVMATGMGMPAMGIYSHELFNGYGVENIIRVGSAGSIQEHVKLYDLVIGQGACTDSNFAAQFHIPGTFAPIASYELLEKAVEAAKENAMRNGLHNCEFIAGDVLKVIDKIAEKPDYIVLDPPRDGVHPKALERIIRYGVPQMVYISCKPTSLARDLEVLQARGYRVEKVCCVDMFPNTVHVETVVLMSKVK